MTSSAAPVQLLVEEIAARCLAATVPFGDGTRPDNVNDGRWIVAWTDAGMQTARTLADPRGRLTVVLTAHCVGLSPEAARFAARALAQALIGLANQSVGGRRVQLPEQLSALPLSIDRDVKPPLFTQTVEWRIRSTPTT